MSLKYKGDEIMVRLRRGSTDHGKIAARTSICQPTCSKDSSGGATTLGINSEQLEHLKKLAAASTEISGSLSNYQKVSVPAF